MLGVVLVLLLWLDRALEVTFKVYCPFVIFTISPLCYKSNSKKYIECHFVGGKNFRLTWSQIRSAGQEVSKHCFDVATELLSCAYTCKHQFRSFPLNLLP